MKKRNIFAVLVLILSLSIGMVANADTTTSDPFANAQTDPNRSESIWASNGVITLTDSKTSKQAVFDARDFETVAKAVSDLAKEVDELNDSLNGIKSDFIENVYVGDDGKIHKVQGGADSVLNFSKVNISSETFSSIGYSKFGPLDENHRDLFVNVFPVATYSNASVTRTTSGAVSYSIDSNGYLHISITSGLFFGSIKVYYIN